MHGGAKGSGAPEGRRNGRYTHGLRTAEAKEERAMMQAILRRVRASLAEIE